MSENATLNGLKLAINRSQGKATLEWCLHDTQRKGTDTEKNTWVWNSAGDLFLFLQEIFNQCKNLEQVDVTCDWPETSDSQESQGKMPNNAELHRKLSKWLFEVWQVLDVNFTLPPKESSKPPPTSPKEGSEVPSKEGSKVPELKSSCHPYRVYGTDYIQWCWQDLEKMAGPRETKEAQVPAGGGQKT